MLAVASGGDNKELSWLERLAVITRMMLDDIDWNVLGKSDDHIVPHQGGERLDESSARADTREKPWREVKNEVEKNMCTRGSAAKNLHWGKDDTYYPPMESGSSSILEGSHSCTSNVVVPALSDAKRTAKGTALACKDGRALDSYVNESNSDTNNNMFCLKSPSLGTGVLTNDNKSCLSWLTAVSPDVPDHSFLEREQKDRDTDLAYYDWPDIDNFEDFDKMFRNWEPTFGQGQTGTADELSWFSSSSNTMYGSEIAFESGFQSSSSDLGMLHAKLESHCPRANILPKNVMTAVDHDKPTSSNYADWLGTVASLHDKSAGKEEVCDRRDRINNPGLTQISNEYNLNQSGASDIKWKQITSQLSLGDKGTKRSSDQMISNSGVLAPQIYSQQFSQQNHFTGSSSSYPHSLGPHSQLDFLVLPAHQDPVTQIISSVPDPSYKTSDHILNHPTQCMENFSDQLYMPKVMASEEDMEKLNKKEQLCSSTIAEHPHRQPAFRNKVLAKENLLENRYDTQMGDVGFELPTLQMDHPIAQESSGTTSVSFDDISEKATSFQKLQGVMHQLDVRTKLCIRDSLYRLARSARQRHGFTTQNFSEGTSGIKRNRGMEASNRSMGFIDVETDTNPIDRSVAHLLFHKPSERAPGCTGNTMSLESHIMNEQVQVPIANQGLIPKQFDQQNTFGACSDMQTDLP